LKNIENELKNVKLILSEKEDQLISVTKSLDKERDEKMSMIEEKNREDEEIEIERSHWQQERQEMKQQLEDAFEASKNDKNARLSELETNEINQAYLKVVKDKESLETENALMKKELKRLQMIISSPNEVDHLKNSRFSSDEDYGYSSSRNTLEKQHKNHSSLGSSQHSEGDFHSLQHTSIQNHSGSHSSTSTIERKLKNFFGFSNRGGKSRKKFHLLEEAWRRINKILILNVG
jgi:myosin V